MKTSRPLPLWRSMLFVPPHVERYVARAAVTPTDAVILDLEDGVALRDRAAARVAVASAAATLAAKGIDVLVRLNHDPVALSEDVSYCTGPEITGYMLPKVEDIKQIEHLQALLHEKRSTAAVLIPTIETPRAVLGLSTLSEISPPVVALALGDEDLSAAIGCDPRSETVQLARQMLVLAAAAQERSSFALISANFHDLQDYRVACERARKQGISGGLCIHPAQVPILNEAFSPTAAEIAAAERVVAANAGDGATSVDGAMVDRPVMLRAAALLARASTIRARERNQARDT